MKKILVPTDFSVYSKSGVRFAIHWATLQQLELVFFHTLCLARPTSWTDSYFEKYEKQEEKLCRAKFEKFIAAIYRNMRVSAGQHSFVIVRGISADLTILDYCTKKKDIDCICISTRGAGKFRLFFGTNTGNLITKSAVPVLAVPKAYKVAAIKSVLYAADFHDYTAELKRVVDFALPLKTTIEVLHFTWPEEIAFDEKTIEAAFGKRYKYGLKIHFERKEALYSFVQNLQNQIRIRKPSLVIMFTNRKRTFFQQLFLSSKAEDLSFKLSVPLLVFGKD